MSSIAPYVLVDGKLVRRVEQPRYPPSRDDSPLPLSPLASSFEEESPTKRRKLDVDNSYSEVEQNVQKYISPYVASRLVPHQELEHIDLDGMRWPSEMFARSRTQPLPQQNTVAPAPASAAASSATLLMLPIPDSQESATTIRTVEQDLEPLPITWDLDEYFDPNATFAPTTTNPWGQRDRPMVVEDHLRYEAELQAQKTTFDRYLEYDGRSPQRLAEAGGSKAHTDPSFKSFFLAPEIRVGEGLPNPPITWPSEIVSLRRSSQEELRKFLASELFDDDRFEAEAEEIRQIVPEIEAALSVDDGDRVHDRPSVTTLGPMSRCGDLPAQPTFRTMRRYHKGQWRR